MPESEVGSRGKGAAWESRLTECSSIVGPVGTKGDGASEPASVFAALMPGMLSSLLSLILCCLTKLQTISCTEGKVRSRSRRSLSSGSNQREASPSARE